MIVIIINSSKKKSFRSSKRLIAMTVQPISNRVAIGDLPKRVLIELLKNLRANTTKGTSIQVFIEAKNIGFRGFKCIQIGFYKKNLEEFMFANSLIDIDLKNAKFIPKVDP